MENDVKFEVTVGSYDDLVILGTYPTRAEALQALGQWFLDHPTAQLMYPAVNEIVQLQPWT